MENCCHVFHLLSPEVLGKTPHHHHKFLLSHTWNQTSFFFLMSFLLTPNPNPNQTSFFFFNVFFTHTSWRCEKKIIKKEVWSANKQIEHPWWLRCKKIRLQSRRLRFDPWVRKIPWRREWQPTPVFLPGEFDGQRSLATSYSPCGCKGTDMTERLTHTQISN